jgi:acetoin utilization deacetylase AcuC-like enzyme
MIAARSLLSKKMVSDVLILDFDGHYGDGTNNIINSLGMESVVRHMTRTQPFGSPDESIGWALAAIEKKPGIVLLQAGADSLINDPFGAGYFTDEQWVSRDRMIFEVCRELRVPIVWNLAGGYNGQITIDMHVKTWESAKYVWS